MKIAAVTANYIAREAGYRLEPFVWAEAHRLTAAAFRGPGFASRFRELMRLIRRTGFTHVELYNAHLTADLGADTAVLAREILDEEGLTLISYYMSLSRPGMGRDEAAMHFQMARALGVPFVVGTVHPSNRDLAIGLCREHGIQFAIENHPEKDPSPIIELIGSATDCLGTTVDTGWWGTQDYDAVAAVLELKDHLLHVHLKDVREAGAHRTCAYGDGVVNVRGVVDALARIGYQGYITVEHEPEHYDPTEELERSLAALQDWLAP